MKLILKILGVIILITLFIWPIYLLLSGAPSFDNKFYDSDHNRDVQLNNYQIGFIGLPKFGIFSHGGGESGGFVILANKQNQWLGLHYTDSIAASMLDYYETANSIGYCRGGETCDPFELSQYSAKPKFSSKMSIYIKAIFFYWYYETFNFLTLCTVITVFLIFPILLLSSIIAGLWYAIKWIFKR